MENYDKQHGNIMVNLQTSPNLESKIIPDSKEFDRNPPECFFCALLDTFLLRQMAACMDKGTHWLCAIYIIMYHSVARYSPLYKPG